MDAKGCRGDRDLSLARQSTWIPSPSVQVAIMTSTGLAIGSSCRGGKGIQRRRLGGLEVSAIGLGCATMTPFYDEPDGDAAIATLPPCHSKQRSAEGCRAM